jgi:hypothetical protein
VTSEQAVQIENLAQKAHATDADLLWLARLCSADETLVHLGNVTRVDAGDMIQTLRNYLRYDAAMKADAKLDEFDRTRTHQ